jgi:hypothetical protein
LEILQLSQFPIDFSSVQTGANSNQKENQAAAVNFFAEPSAKQ